MNLCVCIWRFVIPIRKSHAYTSPYIYRYTCRHVIIIHSMKTRFSTNHRTTAQQFGVCRFVFSIAALPLPLRPTTQHSFLIHSLILRRRHPLAVCFIHIFSFAVQSLLCVCVCSIQFEILCSSCASDTWHSYLLGFGRNTSAGIMKFSVEINRVYCLH